MSHSTRWFRLVMVLALLATAAALFSQAAAAPNRNRVSGSSWREHATGAGKYIVLTKPVTGGVSVASVSAGVAGEPGVTVTQTYSHALNGFAADLSADAVNQLKRDPRVERIVPDGVVHAFAQVIPVGARRVGATTNTTAKIDGVDQRVNADIAILDMGVGPNPDLNIAGGYDCLNPGVSQVDYGDLGGHGTHVAGIAAAIDNTSGVVGVAPGARIWSVRVLPGSGEGLWSDVICGIEWVTSHASTIDVANMSLGAQIDASQADLDQTIHEAIQASVAAGVTYVVAAGNDGVDASTTAPAKYPEVMAVSAFCDSDGKSGGLGVSLGGCADDSFASFSNYGSVVAISAPGVDTVSLAINGGTDDPQSGTSFSSPHVAGGAALYIAQFGRVGPSAVRSALLASTETGHIPNDPSNEGRLSIGGGAPGTVAMGHSSGPPSSQVTVKMSNFPANSPITILFDSITVGNTTTDSAGGVWRLITVPDSVRGSHKVTAVSLNSSGTSSFNVTPGLYISTNPIVYGKSVTFTAKGFKAAEIGTLTLAGPTPKTIGASTANSAGTIKISMATPDAIAGTYTAKMSGNSGSAASRTFTIAPLMALSASSGSPNQSFKISVHGLQAAESITVRYRNSSTAVTLCTANASSTTGAASCTGKVPSTATRGTRTIDVNGSMGTFLSLPFTVVSPPAAAAKASTTTPTPTKAAVKKPSGTATPNATAILSTAVATATPTVAPQSTATETPADTPTSAPADIPTDTATSTSTSVPTETPTDAPTVEPTATDIAPDGSPPTG